MYLKSFAKFSVVFLLVLSVSACGGKSRAPKPTDTNDIGYDVSTTELVHGIPSAIYFAHNSHVLSDESKKVLDKQAVFLKSAGKGYAVTIEGHCDESGTRDYNLMFGEKRAVAAKNYLVTKGGVDGSRISVISYGKERPNPDRNCMSEMDVDMHNDAVADKSGNNAKVNKDATISEAITDSSVDADVDSSTKADGNHTKPNTAKSNKDKSSLICDRRVVIVLR